MAGEYDWIKDLVPDEGSSGNDYAAIANAIGSLFGGDKGKKEEEGFDWKSLLSGGADIAEVVLAIMTANEQSKGTTKEDWKAGNPSYYNPFGQIESDWNGGNPIINHTLTPEVQGIVDSLIIDQLQGGRTPYGMPAGMRDVYNDQLNWQRERYGRAPMENPSSAPDSFTGGTDSSDRTVGGVDEEPAYKPKYKNRDYDEIGTELGDTYRDAGLRGGDKTTYDEFDLKDRYSDGYNRYMSMSNNGFGYNGYGRPIDRGGRDDTNYGSAWGYGAAENAGTIGKVLGTIGSAFTGLPLARVGEAFGNRIGQGYIDNNVHQSPAENLPPSGADLIADAMRPLRSEITVPRDYGNMGYGRNNSITGNGAYGYATRLRPRGGYWDDPRINPTIPADKIGDY